MGALKSDFCAAGKQRETLARYTNWAICSYALLQVPLLIELYDD